MTTRAGWDSDKPILPRSKWWWLGLALILALSAALYLPGYDASLPYIDNPNEPAFNLAAQTIIDSGSARSISFDAYPPGVITLNYLLVKYAKADGAHFSSVLPLLRLLTIATWLGCLPLLALIGSGLARPVTGLLAALIWAVNPWVVAEARFAEANAYVTFFVLLSLWLALAGASTGRRSCSSAAIYSLFAAIVFKTQAIFLLPIIWALPLINLLRGRGGRAQIWRLQFWNVVRCGAFLFWLLLLYPTLEADRIPFWVAPSQSLALPSPATLWANLAPVLRSIQPLALWLAMAFLLIPLARHRRSRDPLALGVTVVAAGAWLIGVSLFGIQQPRQFYVLGTQLTLLFALGLTGLIIMLEAAVSRLELLQERPAAQKALPTVIALALALALFAPAFEQSRHIAWQFTRHDRRNDLARYMDTSLPPGKYASPHDNHKTFNRSWGGYAGINDFAWQGEYAMLSDKPLAEWRALGVDYAVMPHAPLLGNPSIYNPEETVLLKTYPVDPRFRGPDMVVLWLRPMANAHGGRLGGIKLLGYDLSSNELAARDKIIFRHYWRAETPSDAPVHVFNHLLDVAGAIVAQADSFPLFDARRDTTTWDDPDEILLGREFTLSLPADLTPGAYQLVSGFYDPLTGLRLFSASGDDRLLISEITVAPLEG